MWTVLAIIAAAIVFAIWWVLKEIRMDRIAREDEEMWFEATRPADDIGKRWPAKTDL
jgi:hypothetical protein